MRRDVDAGNRLPDLALDVCSALLRFRVYLGLLLLGLLQKRTLRLAPHLLRFPHRFVHDCSLLPLALHGEGSAGLLAKPTLLHLGTLDDGISLQLCLPRDVGQVLTLGGLDLLLGHLRVVLSLLLDR